MYTIGAVADLIRKQCTPSGKAGKASGKSKKSGSEAGPRKPLYTEYKLESPTPPTKRLLESSEKPRFPTNSETSPAKKRAKRKKVKKPKVQDEPKLELSEDDFEEDTSDQSAAEEDTTPREPPPRKRKKQKLSSRVPEETKEVEHDDDDDDDVVVPADPEVTKPLKNIVPESPEKEARTIFVGNLPVTATEKPLRRFFNQYGVIESVRFRSVAPARASLTKKVAYISKSLHGSKQTVNAYVVFKQKDSVDKALAANGSLLLGNHVRVDRVGKKPQVDDRKSVFVGNLPHEIQDEELWNCFSECGPVTGVRVIRDRDTGMGKGFGFVTFAKLDAAALALEMSGIQISGRPIRVTPVSKQQTATKKGQQQQQTGYARRKAMKSRTGLEDSAADFTGARAERLLKKKKLKKVIRSKKQQRQHKAVFGFGGAKAATTPKKEKKKKKSVGGVD